MSLLTANAFLLMNKGWHTFLKVLHVHMYAAVSDDDVEVILNLKRPFEKPFPEVRKQLQNIDIGCPHVHHLKPRGMDKGLACCASGI